jgi:hypothetical protein
MAGFEIDMTYSIEFIPEAASDYKSLDGSVRKKVNKKLEELSKNPFLGDHLGNKFNVDLTGLIKRYELSIVCWEKKSKSSKCGELARETKKKYIA